MIGVALVDVLELFTLPANWEDVAHHYHAAVADLPPDLLIAALRHVRDHCRFFPKPAELRMPVMRDLTERRINLRRLDMAATMVRRRAETGSGRPQASSAVSDGPVDLEATLRRLKMATPDSRPDHAPVITRGERVADPAALQRARQSLAGFRLPEMTEAEVEQHLHGLTGNKL